MKKEYRIIINLVMAGKLKSAGIFLFSLLFFLFSFSGIAQEIEASVDSSVVKIGEKITYRISVETDSTNLVVFPEGETFGPLEVVESYPVDTAVSNGDFHLKKEYFLIQFDSGSYVIPPQKVKINNRTFETDSLVVEVQNVVVDTTKQKLFPIKPSVEVPAKNEFPEWIFWVLGIIALLAIIFFLLYRRKKKKEAAKKLPPYEQAIFELHQLDKSKLLEEREIKQYYSLLSGAVRRYLDEEIYDHAMESTSGELVEYLHREKRNGKLKVPDETIENLRIILQRSDLTKFANSKPDVITAKEDRSKVEGIINETRSAIPEPTEEELLRDEEYRRKRARREKKKKFITAVAIVVLVLGGLSAYLISINGFTYMKETLFGNQTKELLEGDWIRSEYGNPPVAITTPEVLVREEIDSLIGRELFRGVESFESGKIFGDYYIRLSTFTINPGTPFNLELAIDGIAGVLEQKGAKNIIVKREDFSTINGAEGVKVFGKFDIINPVTDSPENKKYVVLNFTQMGQYQQVLMIFDQEDEYAEEITQRVINSVELIQINEQEVELQVENREN